MLVARTEFQACSSTNCEFIYVVGGKIDDGKPTAIVERYNVHTGSWSLVAPL